MSAESDLEVVGRWRGTKDAHFVVLVWRDDHGSDSATESACWSLGSDGLNESDRFA